MPPFFWASAMICKRQRGLAGRLRPENLDDTAARHAADAQRVVDADRAGRNRLNRGDDVVLAEAHDRAFAELLFDLTDGRVQRLQRSCRSRRFINGGM
jgi:hypothetical protein